MVLHAGSSPLLVRLSARQAKAQREFPEGKFGISTHYLLIEQYLLDE